MLRGELGLCPLVEKREVVCFDLSLLIPGGLLVSLPREEVPSQCLLRALHKSKHLLAPGLGSICQPPNYSVFVVG